MIRPRHISAEPRRGVILLVVLTMLTLFSIIGLAFVLYAQSQQLAASMDRQVINQTQADIPKELALRLFLAQLIYGPDTTQFPNSALSGQDLMTNLAGSGAAYTYPDKNNLFLAAVNANGQPLAVSFKSLRVPNLVTPEIAAGLNDCSVCLRLDERPRRRLDRSGFSSPDYGQRCPVQAAVRVPRSRSGQQGECQRCRQCQGWRKQRRMPPTWAWGSGK